MTNTTETIPVKKRKSFSEMLNTVTPSNTKIDIFMDRANMARKAAQSRKPSRNNIFFLEMKEGTSITIPADGRATVANSVRKLGYTVTTRVTHTPEGDKLTVVLLAKFLVNRKSRAILEKKYLELDLPTYQAWVATLKNQAEVNPVAETAAPVAL